MEKVFPFCFRGENEQKKWLHVREMFTWIPLRIVFLLEVCWKLSELSLGVNNNVITYLSGPNINIHSLFPSVKLYGAYGFSEWRIEKPNKLCFCILCFSWKLIIYIKGTSPCTLWIVSSDRSWQSLSYCWLRDFVDGLTRKTTTCLLCKPNHVFLILWTYSRQLL